MFSNPFFVRRAGGALPEKQARVTLRAIPPPQMLHELRNHSQPHKTPPEHRNLSPHELSRLAESKNAVLYSLGAASSQESHRHAIDESIAVTAPNHASPI